MDKTLIKKEIYKQKPTANLKFIRKNVAYYNCDILVEDINSTISFEIPTDDMGDADFYNEMEAKFLLRWLS